MEEILSLVNRFAFLGALICRSYSFCLIPFKATEEDIFADRRARFVPKF